MTGRYLLDTNAVILLLQGNSKLTQILSKASWVAISIITELEFLGFPNVTEADKQLFHSFKQKVIVLSLDASNESLTNTIVHLRQCKTLKLPDAIIASKALQQNAALVTADTAFTKVPKLEVITP